MAQELLLTTLPQIRIPYPTYDTVHRISSTRKTYLVIDMSKKK